MLLLNKLLIGICENYDKILSNKHDNLPGEAN